MKAPNITPGSWWWLDPAGLERLVEALQLSGYRVVGPQVADGAVVIRDLATAADLPTGWLDEQDGGHYRLHYDPAAGTFDHVVGPHSLKNFLFPARETIASFAREGGSWSQVPVARDEPPLAVLGVRGCDLEALRIQDRVFMGGDHVDPGYASRRENLFLVAVNCRRAAATCFCHSMGCGPAAGPSFDLALTEHGGGSGDGSEPTRFACEVGSERGGEILAALDPSPCSPAEIAAARQVPQELAAQMHAREAEPGSPRPRSLDTEGIRDLLLGNLEHPRWEEVASRCLSCTNCTLVCPTCFCASVTEVADLSGDQVDRERHWASCFALDHAKIHGHSVRSSTASRYRQWLTHKLASWIDQFDSSGCTGCGRCITWCPVGIDITEEVAAIRETSGATVAPGGEA
ncbi:MAG: 4Fe-4S dicluster domain-containing protein [Planctomycetota bacterium]|jgi:sulfhydrogenase subunit beta (sulfur reductase)|nr:4Fe-4S dicluster domain-containing protein [Planctomycetota bacterium]